MAASEWLYFCQGGFTHRESGALSTDDQNQPHRLTPEERESRERRIAELTARMEKLDHLRIPKNIAEWAELYEQREALDKQLTDEA